MKVFFADTNIFIRFVIKDSPQLTQRSKNYLSKAKKEEIRIIILSEVILEIEYVLRKVYEIEKEKIFKFLESLIKATYIEVRDRSVWIESLKTYKITSIDLIDILIFKKAKEEGVQILSFDQDFKKLKNLTE